MIWYDMIWYDMILENLMIWYDNTEKNKPSIAIVGIPVNNEYWAGQQYISGITIL